MPSARSPWGWGAVLATVLAAMGPLAALVTECTIEIERVEDVPRSETMRPLGAFMGRRAAREADAISHGGLAAGPGGPEGDPREKGSSQSRQRTSSARGMHNRERAQRYRGAVTMQEKDPTLFFERTTCERIALGAHGAAHYPA